LQIRGWVLIREVINCQPLSPECASPDLGSIVPDITTTVLSIFFIIAAHQTLELVKVVKGLGLYTYCE
jgi:hypothetical protein